MSTRRQARAAPDASHLTTSARLKAATRPDSKRRPPRPVTSSLETGLIETQGASTDGEPKESHARR
jgi:hypothetical protein